MVGGRIGLPLILEGDGCGEIHHIGTLAPVQRPELQGVDVRIRRRPRYRLHRQAVRVAVIAPIDKVLVGRILNDAGGAAHVGGFPVNEDFPAVGPGAQVLAAVLDGGSLRPVQEVVHVEGRGSGLADLLRAGLGVGGCHGRGGARRSGNHQGAGVGPVSLAHPPGALPHTVPRKGQGGRVHLVSDDVEIARLVLAQVGLVGKIAGHAVGPAALRGSVLQVGCKSFAARGGRLARLCRAGARALAVLRDIQRHSGINHILAASAREVMPVRIGRIHLAGGLCPPVGFGREGTQHLGDLPQLEAAAGQGGTVRGAGEHP